MSTLAATIGRGATGSRPAASEPGRLYFDTTTSIAYRDNGSSWDVAIPGALTNPMTTSQDIIVAGASGTPGRLAMGNAGGALARINGALAYNSGTAFPTATAGDRYWRTDLGMEFYYDGTRWLSTQLFSMPMADYYAGSAQPISSSVITHRLRMPVDLGSDLWIVTFRGNSRAAATNNGTNYWTIPWNTPAASAIASFNTSADTAATLTKHDVAVGALLGNTNYATYVQPAKTGTPGNLDVLDFSATFRVVAT